MGLSSAAGKWMVAASERSVTSFRRCAGPKAIKQVLSDSGTAKARGVCSYHNSIIMLMRNEP